MFTLLCLGACDNGNLAHEHVFDKQVAQQNFIASESTCVEKAKYYYSCECGEKGEIIFEYGELKEHDFSIVNKDENIHWQECICGDKTGVENHIFVDGVCVCGKEQDIHIHSYDLLRYDADKHWLECSCGAKEQEIPHYGGTATCEEKAICSRCGKDYGSIKGHNYTYKYYGKDGANNYNITLECSKTDCKKVISAKAESKEIVEPTCKDNGYTIYEYSYSNGLVNKKGTINLDETKRSEKHLLTIDGQEIKLSIEEECVMDKLFSKAITEDKLRIIAGVGGDCSVYMHAIFDCECCEHPIIISLSGEHVLGGLINPCTKNSYRECTLCDYVEYGEVLGHSYERISAMKQQNGNYLVNLKCKNCKGTKTAIGTFKGVVEATCEKGYEIYEYTYNNFVRDVTETFLVNEKEPAFKHYVVCDGYRFEFELNGYYELNETIEYLIEKNIIRLIFGIPVGKEVYTQGVVECDYCDYPFIIYVSGK